MIQLNTRDNVHDKYYNLIHWKFNYFFVNIKKTYHSL